MRFVLIAVVAGVVGASWYFNLPQYWSLETLSARRDALEVFTDQHYAAAVALFIVTYGLGAALSLPGDIVLSIAGGFLFGSVAGTLYINIGATAGATLAFLAARYLLRSWVEQRFGGRLQGIQQGFARNAFSYLLTLRLIPAIPFVLVNLVSGLTHVKLGTYVRASSLGMLPASFVFAYAGQQLGMVHSAVEILSPQVITAFVLLGLLALTPVIYERVRSTRAWAASPIGERSDTKMVPATFRTLF